MAGDKDSTVVSQELSESSRAEASGAPSTLRVAICQINTVVGDLDGNLARAGSALAGAEAAGAAVAIYPELTITGYPPEDLLLKPGFLADARAALEDFAATTRNCAAVIGFSDGPVAGAGGEAPTGGQPQALTAGIAWNALAVCAGGRIHGIYHKRHLPNYDVFDELRHFRAGSEAATLFGIAGVPVGLTLCEDGWIPDGPIVKLARGGARLVINVNGSPFTEGKQSLREAVMRQRVLETRAAGAAGIPIVYLNLVGGQDELVFDGGSFVIDGNGAVVVRCGSFCESIAVCDIELESAAQPTSPAGPAAVLPEAVFPEAVLPEAALPGAASSGRCPVIEVTPAPGSTSGPSRGPLPGGPAGSQAGPLLDLLDPNEARWAALVLATHDYVTKSGFSDVCLGLSGGVDSSLTAAVAVEALGADHVHGVLMPSRYSSRHSVGDAEKLAVNLGIATINIEIELAHQAFLNMLAATSNDSLIAAGDLTDQNLQSRIRGVVLMALANEHGWLVLTTGNKSETAVGYSTLYGDTAGGYAVISDLWKLQVYELCRWRNAQAGRELISEAILTKPPSAELAPGQRDDQSLPPYQILDPILISYVEHDLTAAEISASGLAPTELVTQVCDLVDRAEYKRRQLPPGPRLSSKAFGRDRRLPIVNRYRSRHPALGQKTGDHGPRLDD